jgi:hypothetical protein
MVKQRQEFTMKLFAQTTLILFFLWSISACAGSSASQPVAAPSLTAPTSAALPTFTPMPLPSPTSIPLHQQVQIVSSATEETSKEPLYTLKVYAPVLTGSADPRVADFNRLTSAIVQEEVAGFKEMLAELPSPPVAMGSYFNLGYLLVSPPGSILSLEFHVNFYSDGAAHPNGYSRSFTYDLNQGQEIRLEQLFLPGSNYLQIIADFCSADLSKREIGFDASGPGAQPTAKNYRVWNLTPNGLKITFNAYQVAAYAAGPQLVTIPYATLRAILNPQIPLEEK